jgi:hypothetical protein
VCEREGEEEKVAEMTKVVVIMVLVVQAETSGSMRAAIIIIIAIQRIVSHLGFVVRASRS